MQASEKESRRLRRSLYVVEDVKSGDLVTPKNLRAIRPGDGASPKYYSQYLGKRFLKDCKRGTPMSSEIIEK
jgi:N-acetylneuraminate synthase